MSLRDLTKLPAFVRMPDEVTVVVEATRGSRVKMAYNPATDTFILSYVLPEGTFFPFEFGFIPSTLAEDGDPLDILVILDASTACGCVITARPIGVVEAEQTQDGKTFRNDRLVAVAVASMTYAKLRSIDELAPGTMDQIEHFFISYNEMRGRRFKPLRRAAAGVALELIHRAMRQHAAGYSSTG
jgi:inorganic pyrophosphatase